MFFNYNRYGEVVVYVDGACRGNGTRRARAGVGVWFDNYHELNLSSSVPGVQTNNNAEIYAAIRAIDILIDYNEYCVEIMTDSMYLCDCMTKWINKWKYNGWKSCKGNTVANKHMIQQLDRLRNNMNSVTFTHVRGHNNNHGNEQADMLAWQAANELY